MTAVDERFIHELRCRACLPLEIVPARRKGCAVMPWRHSNRGLVTIDLMPLHEAPRPLFDGRDRKNSGALMAAMDACNSRFGRGAVAPARAGARREARGGHRRPAQRLFP